MKTIKTVIALVFLGLFAAEAQEVNVKNETKANISTDKMTYYQKRGAEDAQYELTFTAKTKADEKAFWKEQKKYEKDLKVKDRKAYRAYIASKKEAYSEHYDHCNGHCNHDSMFYSHASFYYYGYERPYYQRTYSSPSSVSTRISVGTPSLRLGL